MDTNEKLGLIERVNHASEDQAKRTLRAMILRCNVGQPTIARAIKDAIERHTPTPMIVYQQPESEDDDETAFTLSHKKSKKKKNGQDGSSQDENEVASTTSKKRQSTRRGDINADPLVGQLILKKTKAKTDRNNKRSSDHDEEQNNPNSSKNQPKHAFELRGEREQRTCDIPMGEPSQQKSTTVIDLVTSSDDETHDTEQSENDSLDDKSSHGARSAENDSSDGHSSDNDSSDDECPDNEQQDDALSKGVGRSQDGFSKKVAKASTSSDNDDRGTAQSITISMAKASIQNDGINMTPLELNRKRKAPEHAPEDVQNNRAARTATGTQANKRPKRNQPTEPHISLQDRTCRDCGVVFPSKRQLLGHQVYCRSVIATPTADTSADYNVTEKAGNFPQLQAHLNGGVQTAQAVSDPRRELDTLTANGCMGTIHTPFVPAHCDSNDNAPSSDLSLHNTSSVGAETGSALALRCTPKSHDMEFAEKLQSELQRFAQCLRCYKFYEVSHNEKGDCKRGHSGRYRKRFRLCDGKIPEKYYTWSCCGQEGRKAPACNPDKAVKHASAGRVTLDEYGNNRKLRRFMQQFL